MSKNKTKKLTVNPIKGGAGIALALLGAPHAFAAEQANGQANNNQNDQTECSGNVDCITIQGKKIPKNPKMMKAPVDTPRSVTIIPEELIQTTASASLVEALRTVPGITFGAGEGGNPVGDRPFIRGYDTQSSTFVDGVRDISAQSRETFNIESVEVIKGTSGAYAGRGGAGGGVYINSKEAKSNNFTNATIGLGSDDYKRATFDVNRKLSDTVSVRLNGMYHDADVAGRDAVHYERWGIAPSLRWLLSSNDRINLSYYHVQSDDIPDVGFPYNNANFVARKDSIVRVLPLGNGQPLMVNRNNYYGMVDRDFRKDKMDMFTARYEHDFSSSMHIRNTLKYAKSKQDYIYTQPDDSKGNIYYGLVYRRPNTRISDVEYTINQTDLYGSFKTGDIKHSYSAGLELSKEEGVNDSYIIQYNGAQISANAACPASAITLNICTSLYNPNPNDAFTGKIIKANNPNRTTTKTTSLYVFDTVEFNPQWQANLGLRYDRYDASYVAGYSSNSTTGLPIVTGTHARYERKDDLVNWQGALIYKPVKEASIYASYSSSSTPAGNALNQGGDATTISSTVNVNLEPQIDKTAEAGIKWEFFNSKLMLTGAVFETKTDNARITLADGSVAMAGEKRVRGYEVGASGAITNKWDVFGGYTHIDAELVRNGGSGAAYGLLDGIRAPNTPSDSGSVWTNYKITPSLSVGGGVFYSSKVFGNANPAAAKWVKGYTRLDANATYVVNPHTSLQLNIQNLTDETYWTQAYTAHYAAIAPGRSATLTLNLKY